MIKSRSSIHRGMAGNMISMGTTFGNTPTQGQLTVSIAATMTSVGILTAGRYDYDIVVKNTNNNNIFVFSCKGKSLAPELGRLSILLADGAALQGFQRPHSQNGRYRQGYCAEYRQQEAHLMLVLSGMLRH